MIAVGIDISKYKIDVFYNNRSYTVRNEEKALEKFFKELPLDSRVVMEATGKYHRLSHNVLSMLGIEVMVINPFQSRNFARSMNVICKTDKVDSKVLSLYADRMDFKPSYPASSTELELKELSQHLEDLKGMKQELEARLRESEGFIANSLKGLLASIIAEIKETEERLGEIITSDNELSNKLKILITIPGIGKATAIMLLSRLRELGKLSKNQIAALAGLAPRNNDSGLFKGKRFVRGGRQSIRTHLYMPVLGAATMNNKRLKLIYERLLAAGKCKKVALIACMRKLIIWANSIIANNQKWATI